MREAQKASEEARESWLKSIRTDEARRRNRRIARSEQEAAGRIAHPRRCGGRCAQDTRVGTAEIASAAKAARRELTAYAADLGLTGAKNRFA